jgi:hypothetical protein
VPYLDHISQESDMSNAEVMRALAEPFPAEVIGWKPQTVKGARCLAVAYIDARDVMDRLDAVVGTGGWQDSYEFLPDHTVVCTLRVSIGGEWVAKSDVGGESDQKDVGDRTKAAVSDALKRAAVKFGIGRYIYRLDHQWVDFDAKTSKIITPPRLPAWALPAPKSAPAPAPQPTVDEVAQDAARKLNGRVVARSTPGPAGVTLTAKVSKAQVKLLEGLLQQTSSNMDRFLAAYKVQAIADLNQEQYADALCKLQLKQQQQAEKAKQQQAEEDPVGAAEREAIQAEARG